MQATITTITPLTERVRALTIKPHSQLCWDAGQYVHIGHDDYEAKPYSIAGKGDDGSFVIHVAASGLGRLSDYLAQQANTGDPLTVEGPHGHSRLLHLIDQNRTIVFIAGGTGLAPVCACVQAMPEAQPYHIYHAVRDHEAFYAPALGLQATAVISDDRASGDLTGLAHEAVPFASHVDAVFYLIGPPAMIDACKVTMHEVGISADAIFHD